MSESKPWLSIYPKGVPANIDPDKYSSILELLDRGVERFGDLPGYTCMDKTLTFREVNTYAEQFGAYLQSRGLVKGDKIALMMPNLLQYPIAMFGALKAGLILVNTNPLYTPREMLHQFTDGDVKAIVIAENFAANLEKIIKETEISTIILASIGEMLPWPKSSLVNFVVRKVKRMVPSFNLPNTVTFKEAIKLGKKFTLSPLESKAEDVIMLQYTGGTTGVSKGAMLTNRNMIANMLQIEAIMITQLEEGVETILCPLPMYHIFAFTVNGLAMLSIGARNIFITNPRDQKGLVKEIKKYPISIIPGVNTLFNAMLHNDDFKALDFSNLKISVAGGMAVQRSVAEKWEQVTGCPLSEGYGLTESSPVASMNPLDGTGRIGTIGLPVSSTDMRLVDDKGEPVAQGERGEIQIKGPQVMKGYYKRQDETDKVIIDGWLCTGDIGKMHEDGFFEIVDRKKDMILVSGFNVFPNEVEDVVSRHPKVLESAVIGMPDERSGEVVKLFVVKKDKSLTEKEIIDYCRENLTGYKVPKKVVFRKELPKTNVGKILRRKLKEEQNQD
jgi:long-chain acyl-CoA synthetase